MRRFIPLLFAALPAFANPITGAEIDGFGTTVITGSALATYPGQLSVSASATAITAEWGPGFLLIDPAHSGGGGEFGSGSASIGQYSWTCDDSGCRSSNPNFQFGKLLPFTLGVPFQVDISATASVLGSGSGTAYFAFSVYEAINLGSYTLQGPSVTITDPPEVPEPATIVLFCGGLALLAVKRGIQLQ